MRSKIYKDQENRIIRGGIIIFWWLFWLFNVVDKIIGKETILFVGKDRLTQFANYFASIGFTSPAVPFFTLTFVSLIEIAVLIFISISLWNFYYKNETKAHYYLFVGILFSIGIFSFFAVGDQIFGDRVELLEHSTYWISLIISWFIYTKTEK